MLDGCRAQPWTKQIASHGADGVVTNGDHPQVTTSFSIRALAESKHPSLLLDKIFSDPASLASTLLIGITLLNLCEHYR